MNNDNDNNKLEQKDMEIIKSNINMVHNDINDVKNSIDTIMKRFDKLEAKMHTMNKTLSQVANDIKQSSDDSKEKELQGMQGQDNDIKNKVNIFKRWILSAFNGNIDVGNKCIDIIVDQEGFDDIETFSLLTDNDLKEMGIDKKAYRIKLLRKIDEYKQEKDIMVGKSQLQNTEGYAL